MPLSESVKQHLERMSSGVIESRVMHDLIKEFIDDCPPEELNDSYVAGIAEEFISSAESLINECEQEEAE